MATSPQFAATPRLTAVSVATADSSFTSPTNVGTLITGASTGTRVNEIVATVAVSGLSTAAVVRIFIFDGTTYFLFDTLTLSVATSSASVASTRVSATYSNLILPSASWSVRVTTSVSQATHVTALAADL
ncbi:MAG: hypothetical protein EBR82_61455 [Caulobacteraceae bacterium]|nr:hypothetical protein [Caulobacteraceae bacterium]